jgi:hypothetical protein
MASMPSTNLVIRPIWQLPFQRERLMLREISAGNLDW